MHPQPPPQGADLFGDLEAPPRASVRDHLPGLTVAGLATLAAAGLADRYGAPLTLMALLIGLALNFLGTDRRLAPGLAFPSRTLLRLAVILMGVRITFAQMAALGLEALAMLALTVAATLGTGLIVARSLGQSGARGLVGGGAVAICGGSAALAIAATLGRQRISEADVTLTLVGISAMSAAALIAYPAIALALGLSDLQAGYLLGAAIHDVAQAVGAGQAFSPAAGDTATIVKLARVALLAPLLAVLALGLARGGAAGTRSPAISAFPLFILGFFAVAGLNSAGLVPPALVAPASQLSSALLALTIAATAIRTPLTELRRSGLRPFIAIAAATATSFILSLGYALLRLP